MSQVISITVGTENQIGGSLKCQAFVIGADGTEKHISQVQDGSITVLSKTSAPAVNGRDWAEGGGFTRMNCSVADGTLIKLHLHRKRPTGLPCTAAAIFSFRDQGTLWNFTFKGLGMVLSTFSVIDLLHAKGELIELRVAKALGYKCPAAFERFFDMDEFHDMIESEILSEASVAAPSVAVEEITTFAGETVVLARPKELRRIRKRPGV